MVMAEAEICRHYRLALDQRADITVLADLNLCSKKDIIAILQRNGVAVKRKKPGQAPKCNHDYIRKLHATGLTDQEISEAVGVSPYTVGRYRKTLGLPRNIGAYTEIKRRNKHGKKKQDAQPAQA